MAEAHIEPAPVGEVHKSLLKILKELSVAKNGTLPSNMGGKPYLTAVDVSRETKTLFVDEELILLPNEEIFKHETTIHKDRVNVLISITATYTIISTRDGSSVTISGTGDGLAGGTAVASNIASTNALKNALLRTFLITEQSVEDQAKNGPSTEEPSRSSSAAERKVAAAKAATQKPTPASGASGEDIKSLQAKIRTYIGTDEAKRNTVNATMETLKGEGLSGLELHKRLVKDVGI